MSRDTTSEQRMALTPSSKAIKIINFLEFAHMIEPIRVAPANPRFTKR